MQTNSRAMATTAGVLTILFLVFYESTSASWSAVSDSMAATIRGGTCAGCSYDDCEVTSEACDTDGYNRMFPDNMPNYAPVDPDVEYCVGSLPSGCYKKINPNFQYCGEE